MRYSVGTFARPNGEVVDAIYCGDGCNDENVIAWAATGQSARLYRDFMRVRRLNDSERRYTDAARLLAKMENEIPGFTWAHPCLA